MSRARTRYAVVAGAAVVIVGLIAGAVAYLQQETTALAVAQDAPAALQYIPADAALVAFADVQAIMASEFRRQVRAAVLDAPGDADRADVDGQAEFREATGIDIEQDIDDVVAALLPGAEATAEAGGPDGLVVLRGRFDAPRIEALARERGSVDEYRGRTLTTGAVGQRDVAMTFLAPDVLAVGSASAVRRAIDLSTSGGDDITANDQLMGLRVHVPDTSHVWALLRLDQPELAQYLPQEMSERVPPLAAVAASGYVSDGLRVSLTAEARDAATGQDLRDVVQGFIALGRMQATERAELKGVVDSLQLSGTDAAATVTFTLPGDVVRLMQRQGATSTPPPPSDENPN